VNSTKIKARMFKAHNGKTITSKIGRGSFSSRAITPKASKAKMICFHQLFHMHMVAIMVGKR
jgi:hypothetical protein